MLSPRAIKLFLKRDRNDWSRLKTISNDNLQKRMRRLPIRPPIWDPLKKHQKVCLAIGALMKRFAYFNDTGTGKTFLSIALMMYHYKAGNSKHNLVLVPNKTNKFEWAEEGFDKHAPSIKYVVLHGSSKTKLQQIADNPDAVAFIETYAGFVRMVCELKKIKRKRKMVTKLVPNKKLVNQMMKFFDGVYADESTYLRNHKALPYRIVRQLSKTAKTLFILSATPLSRTRPRAGVPPR